MTTTKIEFPTCAEELTAPWLTAQLATAGAIEGEVAGFSAGLVGEGAGMMSSVYRIALTYGPGSTGPDSLIAKFTTTVAAHRILGLQSALYERETNFFRLIAPRGLVPVPQCFASEYAPDTGESILLMQDMVGYRDGDQIAGCDADEAKGIIDAIVPLHVAYWGFTITPDLEWLWQVDSDQQIAAIHGAVTVAWDRCVAGYADFMSEELKAAGPRYVAGLPDLHRRMAQGPQTVVHGDLRLDNMLFGDAPGQHPVVPIDWQALLSANGLLDVSYLLSQNVRVEERREHERELIAHYHRRLTEGGVTGYSLEDCWDAYRVGALYTLAYAVFTCGGLEPKNARARLFMEAMITRASDTVTQHGSLDLLPEV